MDNKVIELAKEILISRASMIRITSHRGKPVFLAEGMSPPGDGSDSSIIIHNNSVLDIETGMSFALAEKFKERAKISAEQSSLPAKKKKAVQKKEEEDSDPDFK